MPGRRLDAGERGQIAVLFARGLRFPEIAELIKRDRSTVWRELKRNNVYRGAHTAGMLALLVDVVVRGPEAVPTALLSTLLWLGVYGGIWLLTLGRGMGLGDVALAPVLGLALGWLGWGASIVGLALGFGIGAVVGVVLIASGRTRRGMRVPHGPFLLSGAAVGLFAGAPIWDAYLRLVGLA